MIEPKRWFFSGICKCGHSWEDHHRMIVMAPGYAEKAYELWKQPAYLLGACEHYGFNEMEGLDKDGNVHCFGYKDKDYA